MASEWQLSKSSLSNKGILFSTDWLMPFAGYRDSSSAGVNYQGSYGRYWSSSRSNTNGAYGLNFSSTALNPQNAYGRAYGFSVRCFKNSQTDTLTLHPDG